MRYILNRLKEPQTYAGLVMLASVVGLHVSPELAQQFAAAGAAVAGLILTVLPT